MTPSFPPAQRAEKLDEQLDEWSGRADFKYIKNHPDHPDPCNMESLESHYASLYIDPISTTRGLLSNIIWQSLFQVVLGGIDQF